MKKLILVIVAQEDGPRMNASSTNRGRSQKEWSIVQGNVPGRSVGIKRNGKDVGKGEVLKISKEKTAITALNALQLLFWPHLCREDLWTVLPWLPQLTEAKEGVQWDRYSSMGSHDQQV